MDVKVTLTQPLETTPEIDAYLKIIEKKMNFVFEHITEEESMRRAMIWGTVVMKQDENGQYRYVEPEEYMKITGEENVTIRT